MHNETEPLDIKDKLSCGLISAIIQGDMKFLQLTVWGTWARQKQTSSVYHCKRQQGYASRV